MSSTGRKMRSATVFVSVTGQTDNIGDTALRREMLRCLRGVGHLHLHVGSVPATYLSGLALDDGDEIYRSRRRWLMAATLRSLRHRVVFAFHAGEVGPSWAITRAYWKAMPVVLLSRIHGGGAVHAGVGLRESRPRVLRAIAPVLGRCRVVSWRDRVSRDWAGHGAVVPDWAFGIEPSEHLRRDDGRDLLTVALRHDRPDPSPEYVDAVTAVSADLGVDIVLVAQTRRDLETARRLAPVFAATVLDWPTDDLGDAEDVVRGAYRRSVATVSNRAHGLILAATEGSIPVGAGTSDVEKLERTMTGAGLDGVTFHAGPRDDVGHRIRLVLTRKAEIRSAVEDATRRVAGLAAEIEVAGSSGRRP